MQIIRRASVALITMLVIGQSVDAAIINAASGKRRAKTRGTVTITTTTSGQRQIAIKIDPDVTTAFRLDVLYPDESVTPVGFAGFNTTLQNEAIVYVEPYASAGPGPSILSMSDGRVPVRPVCHAGGRRAQSAGWGQRPVHALLH
jgi:hypothetical protein